MPAPIFAPSPITVGLPGIVASKFFKAKVVLWVHDLWPESIRIAGGIKSKFVINSIDKMTRWIYNNVLKSKTMSSIILALIGGAILGIAVVGYLYVNGRIAGISGLLAQVLQPKSLLNNPAFWFLSGLFIIPFIYQLFVEPEIVIKSSPIGLIIAGILVGFGTRLGSGCTSGHGICGMSRLSVRSIVATVTFMLAGIVTVFVIRHILGVAI